LTGKCEYYNHYWEDAKARHFDRRSRERALIALGMLVHRSGRLLDAGAGRGVAGSVFKERGFEVTAMDVSPHALAYCSEKGLDACIGDLETDNVGGPYNVIIAMEVLEHLENPKEVLEKLVNALAPDGEMIISMPNDRNIYHSQKPRGEDDPHLDLYDKTKARGLILSCGLRLTDSRGVPLLPGWCIGVRYLVAKFFPAAGTISTVFHCIKDSGPAPETSDDDTKSTIAFKDLPPKAEEPQPEAEEPPPEADEPDKLSADPPEPGEMT
jgi:SAM-dependent methyltransferase